MSAWRRSLHELTGIFCPFTCLRRFPHVALVGCTLSVFSPHFVPFLLFDVSRGIGFGERVKARDPLEGELGRNLNKERVQQELAAKVP